MNQNDNNQQSQNNQSYKNSQNYQNSQNINNNATPAAVETKPVAEEKVVKKSKKPIIITIIAIILVAALAVAGCLLVPKFLSANDKSANESTETKEGKAEDEDEGKEEEVEASKDVLKDKKDGELSTIALYPDREVKKDDLKKFSKMIDERAKVLGEDYEVKLEDDRIILIIDKNLLGSTAAERTATVELLLSRGNVSISENGYVGYIGPEKGEIAEITVKEFGRTDLLSEYRVNMMDERYEQLELIKEDTIYGVEVEFDGAGEKKMKEVVEGSYSSNLKLTAVHDFLDEGGFSEAKFFGGVFMEDEEDFSKIIMINPGASYKKNAEVMEKILEQGTMSFGLVMEIQDEPLWDDNKNKFGENQVDSLKDGVTILCTPTKYSRQYLSEVDFAEYEKTVKERIDVLGIDYMFGTTGFDDKTYCIKVKSEDFAPDFTRLIFNTNGVRVVSAFDTLNSFYYEEIVEEDGKYVVRMQSYYTKDEILSNNTISEDTLYLVVNDVTIASANINNIKEIDGKKYLDFDNFLCFNKAEATEDEKPVLDLIPVIFNNYGGGFEGTYSFRSDKKDVTSIGELDWKYSSLTAVDEKTFEIVEDMCYEADKMVDSRNMLVITLDIPVDDDLPKKFTDKAKEIYNAIDLDSGAYVEVHFVIKDETKESPADQFRLEVTKDTYEGKMIIRDVVSGPKFSDYWSDMYEITEEDSFFAERSW